MRRNRDVAAPLAGHAWHRRSGVRDCAKGVPMADQHPSESRPSLSPQFIHVLRTCETIHLQLSQMADQKASILMGATFLIFTITVTQAKGAMPPLPLAMLGGFAFFSAVLAMSAVMPSAGGKPKPGGQPNLLFFGSFTRLSEAEFIERLREKVANDHDALELMARDIYQNGQVLRRKKYRLLGWAYRVFLVGLTASFVALVWEIVRP
jgi:hypothetical protein